MRILTVCLHFLCAALFCHYRSPPRGLVYLHVVVVTIIASVFLLCVLATHYQNWIELSDVVELWCYLVAVVVGMGLSSHFV